MPLSAVVDDDAPIVRVQFFVDGLPVGLSILGSRGSDATLVAVARALAAA